MDIYRKELNEIYIAQNLGCESLPEGVMDRIVAKAKTVAELTGMCIVVTDAAHDSSVFLSGSTVNLFGLSDAETLTRPLMSSDEDFLYTRMHPEDIVDLRMLEYEFFSFLHRLPPYSKTQYKAVADVRMMGKDGTWISISKATQVVMLSPKGNMWLILCTYDRLRDEEMSDPRIIHMPTGVIKSLSFAARKDRLLTRREKELLQLVRKGKLSKEIASMLGISINTVNRHRQNILRKLSVDNSMEAVNAALAMQLL